MNEHTIRYTVVRVIATRFDKWIDRDPKTGRFQKLVRDGN